MQGSITKLSALLVASSWPLLTRFLVLAMMLTLSEHMVLISSWTLRPWVIVGLVQGDLGEVGAWVSPAAWVVPVGFALIGTFAYWNRSRESAMELQFLADSLNSLPPASTLSQSHISPGGNLGVVRPGVGTAGVGEFAGCVVLEGLGIPAAQASPALLNAIKDGIRAWNWGLTAKTVARILEAGAVKALGGPVAVGVSLDWAAYSCRGKL